MYYLSMYYVRFFLTYLPTLKLDILYERILSWTGTMKEESVCDNFLAHETRNAGVINAHFVQGPLTYKEICTRKFPTRGLKEN